MTEFLLKLFIVGIAVVLLLVGPLVTIWALNLLFGLDIPQTLATWFATLWLCLMITARSRK